MNQLFKKTGNNNFQLLTENVNTQPKTHEVIQLNNGLKKIFCEGVDEISYNKVQMMGFGFIKDIHSAKAVALEESRILAEEFGYRDDVDNKKFIKEEQWNTRDFDTPEQIEAGEEKEEVRIGKEILSAADAIINISHTSAPHVEKIKQLANELIQMHGAK